MAETVYSWGSWTFDPAEWRLMDASGNAVPLPNRTLDLLALLLERAPLLVAARDHHRQREAQAARAGTGDRHG